MLVAPLMGPIVGLAMGLAAGSPFLVLRSAERLPASDVELAAALAPVLAAHPRVTTTTGSEWSVRFVEGTCAPPPPPDAGPADGSLAK